MRGASRTARYGTALLLSVVLLAACAQSPADLCPKATAAQERFQEHDQTAQAISEEANALLWLSLADDVCNGPFSLCYLAVAAGGTGATSEVDIGYYAASRLGAASAAPRRSSMADAALAATSFYEEGAAASDAVVLQHRRAIAAMTSQAVANDAVRRVRACRLQAAGDDQRRIETMIAHLSYDVDLMEREIAALSERGDEDAATLEGQRAALQRITKEMQRQSDSLNSDLEGVGIE